MDGLTGHEPIAHGLTGAQILALWDTYGAAAPAVRALGILASCTDLGRDELLALTVGRRNQMLYACRRRTLGASMAAFAHCPHCGEAVEFVMDLDNLHAADVAAPPQEFVCPHADGCYRLDVRPPTVGDLLALAADAAADVETLRERLLARCVTAAARDGVAVTVASLPVPVSHALAAHLAAVDPWAETLLELACPACATRWHAAVDIGEFFWREVTVQAKRLLREVHLLARGYGWREADILALHPRRRQAYLDLLLES